MALVAWISFGALGIVFAAVVVGLFVEERALQMPRLYDAEALRPRRR